VERFALVIQRDKVAGRQVLPNPLRDEVEEPALRARCPVFDGVPIGTDRRIEKRRERLPGLSVPVTDAFNVGQ
jgi:hypothetical protein